MSIPKQLPCGRTDNLGEMQTTFTKQVSPTGSWAVSDELAGKDLVSPPVVVKQLTDSQFLVSLSRIHQFYLTEV